MAVLTKEKIYSPSKELEINLELNELTLFHDISNELVAVGDVEGKNEIVVGKVGNGVGLPGRYVGTALGSGVGLPAMYVGADDGTGVGLPGRYVGTALGSGVGHEVYFISAALVVVFTGMLFSFDAVLRILDITFPPLKSSCILSSSSVHLP